VTGIVTRSESEFESESGSESGSESESGLELKRTLLELQSPVLSLESKLQQEQKRT
jgi:hypothetical protein